MCLKADATSKISDHSFQFNILETSLNEAVVKVSVIKRLTNHYEKWLNIHVWCLNVAFYADIESYT